MKKKKTDMLRGMLDLLTLRSLQGGPLNGWDIMRRIQIVAGAVFRVIPGSLYPALHRPPSASSDADLEDISCQSCKADR
jgi:hypothetical protein